MKQGTISLRLRRRILEHDPHGCLAWSAREEPAHPATRETALVLCDVWDNHWCRGARERLAPLVPRMNETAKAARAKGILVVHAPSETMAFYEGSPARERARSAPPVEPPLDRPWKDRPLPVGAPAPGFGCDSDGNTSPAHTILWTREHPGIEIDPARDIVSDQGRELYSYYRAHDIRNVLILGVHTNFCILRRSFAIKQLVKWGLFTALVRDLTDSMYSPEDPPYVSHEEGTRLVVEYIEKFWCPTCLSEDILRA
ncbi:MAG: isochorismatase [Planctomycetota bacterium]